MIFLIVKKIFIGMQPGFVYSLRLSTPAKERPDEQATSSLCHASEVSGLIPGVQNNRPRRLPACPPGQVTRREFTAAAQFCPVERLFFKSDVGWDLNARPAGFFLLKASEIPWRLWWRIRLRLQFG